MSQPLLLAIIEMGGYPDFTALYQSKGYRVEKAFSVRKAQAWLKRQTPDLVVAEFHFDPDLRDRMSTLESLLATLQRYAPQARVVVFISRDHRSRLEKMQARYRVFAALDYPIDAESLSNVLDAAAASVLPGSVGID